MTFRELGLSDEVCHAVSEAGYRTATPIQQKSIPHVLMGRDILGTAQTGTGKTAAFLLPMIDVMAQGVSKPRMPRALVLEPTRELAAQVAESFDVYAGGQKLSRALVIGGVGAKEQEAELDGVCDIIVATPGRLQDLFDRGLIMLRGIQFLVIDEADRMMDMGFIPDVERIVSLLPKARQTLFFSATMPKPIRRLADRFLSEPREVEVAPPASPAETVEQRLMRAPADGSAKRAALRKLIDAEKVHNALIFCNRKSDVKILYKSMLRHGYDAVALHGDMEQVERMATLGRFKSEAVKYMVCSDVAARGLDIQGLSHVFNFDVPHHAEDYVHRIGRTGRAGQQGKAFTLVTAREDKQLAAIHTLIRKQIPMVDSMGVDLQKQPAAGDDAPAQAPEAETRPETRSETRGETRSGRGSRRRARSPKGCDAAPKTGNDSRDGAEGNSGGSGRGRRASGGDAKQLQADSAPAAEPGKPSQEGQKKQGMGDHMPAFLSRPLGEGRA